MDTDRQEGVELGIGHRPPSLSRKNLVLTDDLTRGDKTRACPVKSLPPAPLCH